MNALKLRKWDSVEHLKSEEDMAQYLDACLQEAGHDAAFLAKALGNVARAKGMSQLSRDTGLGRESLYKALSGEGNPSFQPFSKLPPHCVFVCTRKPRLASEWSGDFDLAVDTII
jgi:probable addiction module antidote protein